VVVAVDRFVVMVLRKDISTVLGGGGSDGADMWSVYSGSCEVAVASVEDLAVGLRQGTKMLVVDGCGLPWWRSTRKFNPIGGLRGVA
jgi:hypothetical protein